MKQVGRRTNSSAALSSRSGNLKGVCQEDHMRNFQLHPWACHFLIQPTRKKPHVSGHIKKGTFTGSSDGTDFQNTNKLESTRLCQFKPNSFHDLSLTLWKISWPPLSVNCHLRRSDFRPDKGNLIYHDNLISYSSSWRSFRKVWRSVFFLSRCVAIGSSVQGPRSRNLACGDACEIQLTSTSWWLRPAFNPYLVNVHVNDGVAVHHWTCECLGHLPFRRMRPSSTTCATPLSHTTPRVTRNGIWVC
jgi:hypothetical protein